MRKEKKNQCPEKLLCKAVVCVVRADVSKGTRETLDVQYTYEPYLCVQQKYNTILYLCV